jgi:hypothetical protein
MGLITAAKLLLKGKKSMGVIKSIPPNVPKTSMEKATSTVKIATQKMKASMAKIESDVFHGTQKIVKALDKIKKPK